MFRPTISMDEENISPIGRVMKEACNGLVKKISYWPSYEEKIWKFRKTNPLWIELWRNDIKDQENRTMSSWN